MSILFSKVELQSDQGEEWTFFAGGIPRDYDDLDDVLDFQEIMDNQSESAEMTVRVDSYLYGDGETEKAGQKQLAKIAEHFENPEWADDLTPIETSTFTFFFDASALFDRDDMTLEE